MKFAGAGEKITEDEVVFTPCAQKMTRYCGANGFFLSGATSSRVKKSGLINR
jgi:hypothetical protein